MTEKSTLAIVGPTAVGKTSVAIAVAQKINGEIIGLDSRQIYKGMPIGTAQPSAEELDAIPHHLIAVREPNEMISAGDYADLVNDAMEDIRNRGKEPILCGGAGLYLDALTNGIFEESVTDYEIRERLSKEYDKNPNPLLKKLKHIDPEYAEIVHINNKKRLVRALEIFEITGKPPTAHFSNQSRYNQQEINPSFCTILLSMDRKLLEDRIRERTKMMLDNGWIVETKVLHEKFSVKKAHALDSIGYRQICQYLDGEFTLEELEEEIVIRTRQYAKRQLTWFRNRENPVEIDIEKFERVDMIADEIISVWKKLRDKRK
ncbi:MAG: tRNA (adenosine(37)-N6)-dimethylallyltransferase MiaA [Candidatus Marinimicrobia bacterium]|nr:tRNA (adenosine(37)-N6)-dimethylallyltransferase MiaA [Candidatus Neomarinimicrobiota bacterium]